MRKLLLTAYGLCSEEIRSAFLKLVPKDFKDLKVGIIFIQKIIPLALQI